MTIYDGEGQKVLDVAVDDNSYRNRAIMGDNNLTLYYSLAEHVEIPVGAYCNFENARYTLMRPESFKMKHSRNFEYTVIFEAPEAKAKIWKFRNPVDGRLKFPLTAKPREHLQMFVDNMNRRDSGWSVGECIDGAEVLISYDHAFCYDALAQQASELKTEFDFNGKVVSLRKAEYNKNSPLALSYGRGNGFKPNVGRSNYGDNPPVEILFVQGGTDNIDRSKYGNSELLLPKLQTIAYDGTYFEDEDGFNSANARTYVVDDLGLSIRRADKEVSSLAEDSIDCSEIYPKRVGTISSVVVEDEENNFYDIIDNSIPASLNYEDCLIEGETMTIIFQSGMLAGKEFDVKYIHDEKGGKKARRFEIVPQEIDGQTMPNAVFAPKAGDTYAVFNCMLPDSYICDNATKSGAEWDMFRSAVKYMFDNEDMQFSFTGELDGIWAKKDWVNIGGKIRLGGYVKFSDERFQKEGVLVRIVGIKDYINSPHSPELTLSNSTVTSGFTTTMRELQSEEVLVEDYHQDAIQFTKRRFRDAKETISMLEEALLDNFTNSINPIAVQTMSMLVGDESLQFRFVNSRTNPQPVNHRIVYDNETRQLTADAGIIQHMTLGIDTMAASHEPGEYKFWDIKSYVSAYLGDGLADKKYYLYAKCGKADDSAEFLLSETAVALEGVPGFWHLLVGILNSEYDGERSFVTLYGFTEILPGRITTDKIVSGSGTTFWDLVQNILRLGDRLQYNVDGSGTLLLNGAFVQTGDGTPTVVGAWCGEFDINRRYQLGDEVWKTVDGKTSTYRYVNAIPSSGHDVTDPNYWIVSAAGIRGEDGTDGRSAFKSIVFRRLNGTPATPTGGSYASPVPSGWSDGVPDGTAQLWMSTRIFTSDGQPPQEGSWTAPSAATDTADIDFEFSSVESSPGTPSTRPGNWHDSATSYDIWMAVRKCRNGVWGDWEVNRIRGEDGTDGRPGEDGHDGNGIVSVTVTYNTASSGTVAPVGGWSTDIPPVQPGFYLWTKTYYVYSNGTTKTVYSVARFGKDGADGSPGKDGRSPACPYVGYYNPDKQYYGTEYRTDIVYDEETKRYYIAKPTVGTFSGIKPTNTAYWNDFGASYDSIATGFLFSEMAVLENAVVRMLRTAESGRRVIIEDNCVNMYDDSGNLRLSISGDDLAAVPSSTAKTVTNATIFSKTIGFPSLKNGWEVDGHSTGVSFSLTDSANVVTVDKFKCEFKLQAEIASGTFDAQYSVGLMVDGTVRYLHDVVDAGIDLTRSSHTYEMEIPEHAMSLAKGPHTLQIYARMRLYDENVLSNGTLSYSCESLATTLRMAYTTQKTEVRANGFRVMFGSNYMFQCVKTGSADSSIEFLMRAGNYGLRVTSSGLQKMTNGATWASL